MSDEATRIWTVPNIISVVRLAGVPLFLWLVLGPEADALALVVLMVAGFTDFLDGYLARRLDQFSKLGEILDPVADRLYILAVVDRALPARHHPVVGGARAAAARPAALGAGADPAHPRLPRAAGPLPRQGRDLQPALRVPAAAARRGRRASSRRWPTSSAGPSPGGGSASTGGPACSTPGRCARCCATHPGVRRRRPTMAEPRRGRSPSAPLPEHVTTPLLTLITARSMDEDYAHVAQQRAAAGEAPHAGDAPALGQPAWPSPRSACWPRSSPSQTDREAGSTS